MASMREFRYRVSGSIKQRQEEGCGLLGFRLPSTSSRFPFPDERVFITDPEGTECWGTVVDLTIDGYVTMKPDVAVTAEPDA